MLKEEIINKYHKKLVSEDFVPAGWLRPNLGAYYKFLSAINIIAMALTYDEYGTLFVYLNCYRVEKNLEDMEGYKRYKFGEEYVNFVKDYLADVREYYKSIKGVIPLYNWR